jgi:hypothetical protein
MKRFTDTSNRSRSEASLSRLGIFGAVTIFVAVGASSAVAGVYGRYLLDPSMSSIVQQYGNLGTGANPFTFDKTVTDTTKGINAGQIKFDYDTYSHQNGAQGGAAMAGGFFMNAGVKVKNGFSLQWVQTVTATNTGVNAWNLPASGAGEFPDVSSTLTPFYPNQSVPVTPPPGLTLGFQDFPSRNYANGAQSWIAELGLVAVSNTANINMGGMMFREVRVIDTFLWGFDFVDTNGNGSIDGLAETVASPLPSFWSDPTASYLNTLNSFFDGLGGGSTTMPGVASGKFKFFNNDNAFALVPSPSSLALLGMAGIIAIRRRR